MTLRITSFAPVRLSRVPSTTTRIVSGTRSQRRRNPVVEGDDNLRRVPHLLDANLIQRKDGHREHLVHVQKVHVRLDDVAGGYALPPARFLEDLLRNRLAAHRPPRSLLPPP